MIRVHKGGQHYKCLPKTLQGLRRWTVRNFQESNRLRPRKNPQTLTFVFFKVTILMKPVARGQLPARRFQSVNTSKTFLINYFTYVIYKRGSEQNETSCSRNVPIRAETAHCAISHAATADNVIPGHMEPSATLTEILSLLPTLKHVSPTFSTTFFESVAKKCSEREIPSLNYTQTNQSPIVLHHTTVRSRLKLNGIVI